MRPIHVVLIVVIVLLASSGLWFGLAPSARLKPSDFFETNQDYDTTGGQPMRPRWKE